MKLISTKAHGVLDYVTVAIFALAPSVLDLTGLPMLLSYTLALVHLLMTVLTDFSMGMFKVIPLKLHGYVEHTVGIVIPVLPFVLGFEGEAFYFYLITGVSILVVGLVSHYEEPTLQS